MTKIELLIACTVRGWLTQKQFEAIVMSFEKEQPLTAAQKAVVKTALGKLLPLWNGAEEKMTAQRRTVTDLIAKVS